MYEMRKIIAASIAVFMTLAVSLPAFAATEEIQVSFNTCTDTYDTDDWSLFDVQYPVTFKLPSHKDMNITLNARLSYGFTDSYGSSSVVPAIDLMIVALDWADGTPPGVADCVYTVRFLDKDKKEVWKEVKAIENGKSREFFVGSNVRYVQVRSHYAYGPFEVLKSRIPGGGISLDS
jgi:hypothetical protein